MTDSMATDPQNPNHDLSSEFYSLPMPPLDSLFSDQINCNNNNAPYLPDLDLGLLTDDIDFDFNFDLTDDFFLNDASDDQSFDPLENSGEMFVDLKPEVVRDLNPVNNSAENSSNSVRVLNLVENWEENSLDPVRVVKPLENSGENSSNSVRVLNSCSEDLNYVDKLQSLECGASPGPVSSQGSGSPEVSWKSVIDVIFDEIRKPSNVSKRKKEEDNNSNVESTRNSKFRRSSSKTRVVAVDDVSGSGGEDEKKKARLLRNRESAQLSRQRKKHYVEELEDKLRAMHSTVQDLSSKISYFMAENANLRQQLSSGGGNIMNPQPPYPGMYPPHPSMVGAYPWMPPGPYMVKAQGSQVPLVPIPRLKPQQPLSAPKSKKSDKESKKTKKVASISFLGLLFFMLLFGGLVPMINVKYGGEVPGVSDYAGSNRLSGQHFDRIFTVNGHSNASDYVVGDKDVDFDNRISRSRALSEREKVETDHKEMGSRPLNGTGPIGCSSNSTEPLVASLYVPRNDKLVKIDGNLIIQSVMASEKAMASTANNEHTSLAIAESFPPALAYSDVGRKPYLYRSPTERQRALTSGSTESVDGKMQQWFREGLAGPMMSSGMCTEVFHFEVSPEAIVPASSPSPNSTQTHISKARNRRFLGRLPLPFNESTTPNVTDEHGHRTSSQKLNFDNNNNNKSLSSSMVVSVLVDPREVGDSDSSSEGIGQKSLPRIFIVVLLDSVKYVTYSCMLPFKGSGPHLVTK